jgi:iron complex outermembrane receptor protein
MISRDWLRKVVGKMVLLTGVLLVQAVSAQQLPEDLTELSLEELMELRVTSASKKPQRISDVAAAIFVITPEDIRRSGATNIPEVLRLVPGVHVAQIDANKWAVTIRGFNNRFANKLLVLMDGRSLYTPLFSGVF